MLWTIPSMHILPNYCRRRVRITYWSVLWEAEAKSAVFYNRVKGELEQYIESLDLDKVSILRPSLLLGERNE